MASTFTPNIQLEEPARGDQVGAWDTPVNNNMTLIDLVAGNITTISLNNANVTLSAAQFQSKQITFNSTLTGSCFITFPTSFTKSYEIQNLCTGSSAFTVVLQTASTSATKQGIGCPPGETIDVFNDGTNMKFKNIGRVGEYWDYAGSSVPLWVTICTIAPFLNCDGTSISSATYPQLVTILGGTTLPDIRGTVRAALNQGTNRITTAGSLLDGNTRFSVGGNQLLTAHNHTGTTDGENVTHTHNIPNVFLGTTGVSAGPTGPGFSGNTLSGQVTAGENNPHTHTFTTGNTGGGASANMPPTTISGICMIRAG